MTETNDFDDIMGLDNSSESKIQPTVTNTDTAKPVVPLIKIDSEGDGLPVLMGSDYPPEYMRIVDRVKIQYDRLPKINYDAIYKEISELSICSNPTPTLQVLNDELHRVQASKDRLSEILIDVIKTYNFKNRAVDILKDAWGKFTTEKNTEGRKGDATFRLSDFMCDFAQLEALSKACNHVLKNLDSLHDNLSRRITIWQLILKLRDVGRGSLPDFDFSKNESMTDLFSKEVKEDVGGNGEPTERDF